jgi:PAS domain S-box-containing protein
MNDREKTRRATFQETGSTLQKSKGFDGLKRFRSQTRLFVITLLSVFFGEVVVMMVISALFPGSPWLTTFLDALILTALLYPLLYFLFFRPLVRHIDAQHRAEAALRDSETRFRALFQMSPNAITICRVKDGQFTQINERFTELIGYTAEDVIGKTPRDIKLFTRPETYQRMISGLTTGGGSSRLEAGLFQKEGNVIEAFLSARIIELDESPHLVAVIRDISELKKAEKRLLASHHFLQIANRHGELNPLLTEFIDEIKKMTDCYAVGMRIVDEEGKFPYQAFVGFSQEFYQSENNLSISSGECICMKVIRAGTDHQRPFFTQAGSFFTESTTHMLASLSEAEKRETFSVCKEFGYESVAMVPIRMGDKILGLIHVADRRKGFIPFEVVEILEGAAMQLGHAIERVQAEEALKKSNEDLERQVEDRTTELVLLNQQLTLEIKERQATDEKLLIHQEKLRSLSSELLLTEARERRELAIELHDRIGQTLAITKIKLGELGKSMASSPFAGALKEIRGFIEQTIQDTRFLTFELSPPVLYELGLEAALAWLVKQTEEKNRIRIAFKDDGQPKPLDEKCRVIIFRATRELLLNILKHAQAKTAVVSMQRNGAAIRIDIEDDGVGFDTSELSSLKPRSGGFGLFSIMERLRPLDGRLEIESEPGSGSRVTIVLPLSCTPENTRESHVP